MLGLLFAATVMATTLITGIANAQSLNLDRPFRIVVPFNAGGYADALARVIADGLSQNIRQSVVVENRPGGFVAVGAQYVMNQPADGHTIMLTGNGMTAVKRFNPNITIDLHREFSVTNIIVKSPLVTVISRETGISNISQMIDSIRQFPERYSFASMSGGGIPGMGAILFLNSIQGKMLNIPYSGLSPAMIDLQANRISMMFVEIPSARQLVDNGNIPILVSSSSRISSFPDTPTWRESNIDSEFYAFQAFWVRSNTPRYIRQELNRILTITVNSENTRRRLIQMGLDEKDIINNTLEEHESFINNEIDIWSPKQ
jgi:tripartite-type tricarboxylate transporter receptor subunit TctC